MRVIRKLLARWIAFNAIGRVLARRAIARDDFMPVSRRLLLMDAGASDELTFDDMIGIVYRGRRLHEAVVMQMTNIAAFWRCRSELAVSERDRDEACDFLAIVTEAAIQLAAEKVKPHARDWIHGLIEARAREERTHHPDYSAPQWGRSAA